MPFLVLTPPPPAEGTKSTMCYIQRLEARKTKPLLFYLFPSQWSTGPVVSAFARHADSSRFETRRVLKLILWTYTHITACAWNLCKFIKEFEDSPSKQLDSLDFLISSPRLESQRNRTASWKNRFWELISEELRPWEVEWSRKKSYFFFRKYFLQTTSFMILIWP